MDPGKHQDVIRPADKFFRADTGPGTRLGSGMHMKISGKSVLFRGKSFDFSV